MMIFTIPSEYFFNRYFPVAVKITYLLQFFTVLESVEVSAVYYCYKINSIFFTHENILFHGALNLRA